MISDDTTIEKVAKLLSPGAKLCLVYFATKEYKVPDVTILPCKSVGTMSGERLEFTVKNSPTPVVFPPDLEAYEFGKNWFKFIGEWLAQGKILPNKVVRMGGLENVPEGLQKMMRGEVSGEKLVYQVHQ